MAMLHFAAHKLGSLNDNLVYLGGCVIALYITSSAALDVRPTIDVDCIVDVCSLMEYHEFTKRLREKGFFQSPNDSFMVRWRYDDIILDVVPANEKILGFSNRWYQEAFSHAIRHQISKNLSIKLLLPTYFIATKLEAFKARGDGDFYASHDLEDIVTVIYGRDSIVNEMISASEHLYAYLRESFRSLLNNEQFLLALPGHLNQGPYELTMQRVGVVLVRIRKMIGAKK